MKINLKTSKYYFLTCNNVKRRSHMFCEFKNYNLSEVNPISIENGISKEQSGSSGFSRMLDLAVSQQDITLPFSPFILLEDDVKKYREIPDEIEIPDNSDLLYIGLSSWGMTNGPHGSNMVVCQSNVKGYDELVRVYNMLSAHGVIVCSIRGLITLQKCLCEDFYRNRGWDMSLAHIQPHINAYAYKIPMVYQYAPIGGQEQYTKIEITTDKDKDILKEWINVTNMSYRTMNPTKIE